MRAFVLNSEEKVKEKLEMLSSLSQIQIYSNLMNEKAIDDQLPDLDKKYSKLKCEITPLQKDAAIYPILIQYLKNTHAKTHDKYTIELIDIFTLRRPQESEKFIDSLGNKMLLWHGSRLTNYVGILSEGLKIAPYEAPSTGYMFGKGIYFADIASKSANYCLPKHNSSGLLLLCEVALGEMNDKFASDYTAHNLPPAKQSTRGVGKFAPSKGVMVDGVLIPNG
jgi:poly [ADP-ribose] polymerase